MLFLRLRLSVRGYVLYSKKRFLSTERDSEMTKHRNGYKSGELSLWLEIIAAMLKNNCK